MPYIGNVVTSFAVETGNINDQAVTAPKLSATGGTDGQVLALDAGGNLVWTSDPAGQWVTSGNDIYYNTGNVGIGTTSPATLHHVAGTQTVNERTTYKQSDNTTDVGSIGRSSLFITGGGTNDMGISSADALLFAVNGLTEAARIDSFGRLLVGTTSASTIGTASARIHSEVTSANWTLGNVRNTNDNLPAAISFAKSRGTTAGSVTTVQNGDGLGALYFHGANGSNLTNLAATIAVEVDGVVSGGGANDMPGRIVFSTTADGASSPTERCRITNSGAFKASTTGSYPYLASSIHEFVANTAGNVAQVITHSGANPYGCQISFSASTPDNNTNTFLRCVDATATRTIIYSDGDVWTSDAGTLTSDITLKRDITDTSPKLADVMNLRVRNFYWQEDYHPNKQDKKLIGFIAQEFEEVFPALVSEHKIKGGDPIFDEDGNDTGEKTPEVFKKGIKEAKLVPILVKALQEAVERIEHLEAKVAALETQ